MKPGKFYNELLKAASYPKNEKRLNELLETLSDVEKEQIFAALIKIETARVALEFYLVTKEED